MLIDTHIHLSHCLYDGQQVPCIYFENNALKIKKYVSRDDLINEFRKKGGQFCIEPGIDLDSNKKALNLCKHYYGFLYVGVGIHPTRTLKTAWQKRHDLKKMAVEKNVIAIGEIGLDYHYPRLKQHRLKQKKWMIWQLNLATQMNYPILFHIRDADKDMIRILRCYKKKKHLTGGIYRCFTKDIDLANIFTQEFGILLGIGATILRDDATELHETVRQIDLAYLVLETDGPYVKPPRSQVLSSGKQWKKGRNSILILPAIIRKIASIKGMTPLEVEKVTTQNALKLFNISPSSCHKPHSHVIK